MPGAGEEVDNWDRGVLGAMGTVFSCFHCIESVPIPSRRKRPAYLKYSTRVRRDSHRRRGRRGNS